MFIELMIEILNKIEIFMFIKRIVRDNIQIIIAKVEIEIGVI